MADGQKLKVFISYSRKDSTDFADELVAGLELAGFAPFLDRHDIAAGEDWETRLGGLISEADTVVYVISPEAVKSERCAWEVDKTLGLSKRLIPVTYKPVPETDIPQRLGRLQFIRFDMGRGITRPLAQLAEALRQDLDWIREHTRIADHAARWQARGRPPSLLLRGDDLNAARAWAAKRKPDAPDITDVQSALLNASIAESRIVRRQTLLWRAFIGMLAFVVIAGMIAWLNEAYLRERWRWFATIRPYMRTQVRPLTVEAERVLKANDAFTECTKDCPMMVVIPAGSFDMGSPENAQGRRTHEGPQHLVTIVKPFAVSKLEATWDEWTACIDFGDCAHASQANWGGGIRPVINVTWEEVQRYVRWLSKLTGKTYRLLTEAEWEYAARAGTYTAYSWGNGRNPMWAVRWWVESLPAD